MSQELTFFMIITYIINNICYIQKIKGRTVINIFDLEHDNKLGQQE